jgi:hypothetical protein
MRHEDVEQHKGESILSGTDVLDRLFAILRKLDFISPASQRQAQIVSNLRLIFGD